MVGRRHRGRALRAAGAALATLVALGLAASPASADKLGNRELSIEVDGRATNGYDFHFQAFKDSSGKAAAIELEHRGASAFYLVRHPRRVNKDRVSVDFGDLGKVSLRLDGGPSGFRGKCSEANLHLGFFRGGIRFNGEGEYARIRERRPFGVIATSGTVDCGEIIRPERDANRGSVLGTCGGQPGAGFFAGERSAGSPTSFLGSMIERSDRMLILRTLFVDGVARDLKVAPDRRSGVVRPPEPFLGRARFADGELTGNLRASLPGAGLVELTPGHVQVAGPRSFEIPHCFPFLTLDGAGSTAAAKLGRMLGR